MTSVAEPMNEDARPPTQLNEARLPTQLNEDVELIGVQAVYFVVLSSDITLVGWRTTYLHNAVSFELVCLPCGKNVQ